MSNVLKDLLFRNGGSPGGLADVVAPRRTFDDVILPPATRRALERALVQIRKHDLLYRDWGLAERHSSGLGLAFNFAGPPGTGKTICAEAVAHALDRRLMVVRHADLQSMWVGQTGKNVVEVFQAAAQEQAVLFFDEADAIAGRRFTSIGHGYEREFNAVVSVLLRELEEHPGVVIFASNLATNFDPAFERRIRAHILFEMPDAEAREQIWRVQLHARKTPLAGDVDFRALAERFAVSGGDIKNAVLKGAQAAVAEPGPDARKQIHQRHFIEGMEDVLASKQVMQQSLFAGDGAPSWELSPTLAERQDELQERLAAMQQRLDALADRHDEHPTAQAEAQQQQEEEGEEAQARQRRERRLLLALALAALVLAVAALALALL